MPSVISGFRETTAVVAPKERTLFSSARTSVRAWPLPRCSGVTQIRRSSTRSSSIRRTAPQAITAPVTRSVMRKKSPWGGVTSSGPETSVSSGSNPPSIRWSSSLKYALRACRVCSLAA